MTQSLQTELFSEAELWALPQYDVPEYRPPTVFPRISQAKRIRIDLETQGLDPLRGGYIVGVAIGADNFREYYPIAHKGGPNCEKESVIRWLQDELTNYEGELVGANSNLYDGFYLRKAKVTPARAKWRDVQWAEALLDEYADNYRLNTLAGKYLNRGKLTAGLEDKYGHLVMEHFSEVQPAHAAPYALQDIDLLDVYDKQVPELEKEGLFDLFDLECRLTPMLHYMRDLGVDVDLRRAEQLEKRLRNQYAEACRELDRLAGVSVDPYSSKSLAKAFDTIGISYPLTAKGNPSFKNDWLKRLKHPFADTLNQAREFEKIRGTFVEGYILNGHINGTIHAELHPLRRADEDGVRGTVSGRFSSSNPNLQNIPVRTELGKLIRELFVPQILMRWHSDDYSQMEYRLLVHYAVKSKCDGATVAQQAYVENPDTDFHQMVSDLTGVDRKPAKNLNFGLCYGMGVRKLAASLGLANPDGSPKQEALDIMEKYHAKAPFIKAMYNKASDRAAKQGFVKTILNRRCRFPLYEPMHKNPQEFVEPLPYDEAVKAYGENVKRAGTHKALNRILQGSNADVTKKAMVDIWEGGLLKDGNITVSLTVHDELDGSVDPGERGDKALGQLKELMTEAIPLNVPVLVSAGTGENWGEAH